MPDSLLFQSLVLVLASAAVIGICLRLGISPIVGYLATGLAIGPGGLDLVAPGEGTRFLAELGVVLLMFMVGLEFSLPKMIAARSVVFGMGGAQVALSVAAAVAIARLLGVDWPAAVLLAGALAMSSTAIALKQLSDQGELNSQHGRLAVGVLLFQDLATLPFLVLIGALAGDGGAGAPWEVLRQSAVAIAGFLVIAFVSRPALGGVLAWAARRRSAELFLLVALAMALGTAWLAGAIGLSVPIGAFLAGMIIGESDFRHQVEEDIRPFRDVLLGLFFLTIGAQIDLAAVGAAPALTAGLLAGLVLGKAALVYLLALATPWRGEIGRRAAVVLGHGGEFGLLIVTQALGHDLMPAALAQPTLAALVVSMALAPTLIQLNARIARAGGGREAGGGAPSPAEIAESSRDLSGHVVLCGVGRVGRLVATVLEASGVPYVGIESDLGRLRRARRQGHRVVFADASRARILDAAGLDRAAMVVITFDQRAAVERMVHHIRLTAPGVYVAVSPRDDHELAGAALAGVSAILPENLAAGLSLGAHVLHALGFDDGEIARRIDEIRAELNPELQPVPEAGGP